MAMSEGVFIADRSAGSGCSAMHPTAAFSAHRWRLARGAAPGSSTATECPVHRQFLASHQFGLICRRSLRFRCAYDTHNSLTASVDMDVLDRDLLLTFAAKPLQGLYLQCEGSQQLDC